MKLVGQIEAADKRCLKLWSCWFVETLPFVPLLFFWHILIFLHHRMLSNKCFRLVTLLVPKKSTKEETGDRSPSARCPVAPELPQLDAESKTAVAEFLAQHVWPGSNHVAWGQEAQVVQRHDMRFFLGAFLTSKSHVRKESFSSSSSSSAWAPGVSIHPRWHIFSPRPIRCHSATDAELLCLLDVLECSRSFCWKENTLRYFLMFFLVVTVCVQVFEVFNDHTFFVVAVCVQVACKAFFEFYWLLWACFCNVFVFGLWCCQSVFYVHESSPLHISGYKHDFCHVRQGAKVKSYAVKTPFFANKTQNTCDPGWGVMDLTSGADPFVWGPCTDLWPGRSPSVLLGWSNLCWKVARNSMRFEVFQVKIKQSSKEKTKKRPRQWLMVHFFKTCFLQVAWSLVELCPEFHGASEASSFVFASHAGALHGTPPGRYRTFLPKGAVGGGFQVGLSRRTPHKRGGFETFPLQKQLVWGVSQLRKTMTPRFEPFAGFCRDGHGWRNRSLEVQQCESPCCRPLWWRMGLSKERVTAARRRVLQTNNLYKPT